MVLMLCASVPPLTGEQVHAASEKNITIYMSDYSSPTVSYDFSTAFGLDTLVTPAYATGYRITWKSSNRNIADVDENGHVLGMMTGAYASKSSATCTITATVTWNGYKASDSIKVTVVRGTDMSGNFFTNSTPDFAPQADTDNYGLEADHVEGEMLVVFDDDVKKAEIAETLDDHGAELEQVTPLGEGEKAALATCENEEALEETMESLSEEEGVAYVQPNYIYTLDDSANTLDGSANTLDDSAAPEDGNTTAESLQSSEKDPYMDKYQYFHKALKADKAWTLLDTNGISQTTTVGVVDSGVDADHVDLKGNLLLTNGKFKQFNGNTSTMSDTDNMYNGHGTHVSGIIGAVYGNGIGGAGVASGDGNRYCKILPAGVVSTDGTLTSNAVINGINYVVNNGAKVVNMSFGSDVKDRSVCRCVANNYYNKNVVFVASAGNKEKDELSFDQKNGTERLECHNFPADMKEVISVCNIDSSGNKNLSSFSGLAKDVSAPGTNINSTIPYDQKVINPTIYGGLSGTSMASPMVSGVAALMLDANPDLTPAEIRNIICATSYDTSSDYYKSHEIGYGRIDAEACVKTAYAARSKAPETEKPTITIKSYYADEPDPYVIRKSSTTTTSRSISKIKDYSAKSSSRKIKLSFDKASVVTTKTTNTTTLYITGFSDTTTTKKKSSSTSGVKYQIRVKRGGTTKYYNVSAGKKKVTAAISVSPSKDSVRVNVKKFGSSKLKKGKTYYVSVRAYKKISGKTKYGKWSSKIKIKVK